ncbi:endonuclease domain-containing protein, partial [Parvimonas sp. M13]
MTEQICTYCKKPFPLEEFVKPSGLKVKKCSKCRTRQLDYMRRYEKANPQHRLQRDYRAYHFKKKYGITYEDYDRMAAEQGGQCKICMRQTTQFNVDHCHSSGKV